LQEFLEALPESHRYAFEFRDESWWQPAVYRSLERHHAAFCIYDLKGTLSPKEVTTDFVYIRLHGPSDRAYEDSYDTRALSGWAGAFSSWLRQGRDIFCYFDNDQHGHAPHNALRLLEML
jgi:uncharacterized protein YecE (DUF72 family)